jgi:hypothetical protein
MISESSQRSLASPFFAYGWPSVPPISQIPPIPVFPAMQVMPVMPQFTMDTPLLPPTAPFMRQQYGRSRSRDSPPTKQAPGRVLESVPNGRAIPSRQNHAITVPAVMSTMAETRQLSLTLRRTTVQHTLDRVPKAYRGIVESVPIFVHDQANLHTTATNGIFLILCSVLVKTFFFAFMVLSLHLIVGALPGLSHASLATCHHRTSLWTVFEQHNYSHLSTSMHTPQSFVPCLLIFFCTSTDIVLHVIVPSSTHT